MESIWTLAGITEPDFAATSALLAIKAKQRSISDPQQADDQSSDESEPGEYGEDEDAATTKATSELATFPRDALKDKFLDRLAEVFSREKSSAHCRGRKDSSHVAATAWIEADARSGSPLTVIVAKNEGLDARDREMMSRLQIWLRAVSLTGQDRSAQTDKVWIGDGGLVNYSRSRLLYHISQIMDKKVTELAKSSTAFAVQITHLRSLCRDVNSGSTIQHLSSIVDTAHRLRTAWKCIPVQPEYRKAVRSINLFARLRAAYDCFKSVALTFDAVSTIELRPVNPTEDVRIKPAHLSASLKRLCGELQLPRSFHESKAARKYTKPSCLHIHAEMQILASLGDRSGWHPRAHRYIGVSKKLCFLCSQILQNYSVSSTKESRKPTFRARQCHGKIYPMWTLPQCGNSPPVVMMALAAAISHAHRQMLNMLQQGPVTRTAIAESSAGVTSAGSTSARLTEMKKQYSTRPRTPESTKTFHVSERPSGLGRKVKTVKVGVLPADGSKSVLVPITFHALPKNGQEKMRECAKELVPDFQSSWGEYQFDRQFHHWTFEDEPSEDSNGEYRLYWNENTELPENESVKRLLGMEEIDAMRRFWYGDVFLVRFSEDAKSFDYDVHDAPATSLRDQTLRTILRYMWDKGDLENELRRDQDSGEYREKSKADKAIILQRMLVTLHHHLDVRSSG
jgi:hypothetical protein